MTAAEGPVERALFRTFVLVVLPLAITCIGLLIAVIALTKSSSASDASTKAQVASAKAQQASEDAAKQAKASCGFWHDISLVPLTPTSSPALLTIIADARVSFSGLGCVPALPAADPRVANLLPPGVR